MHIRRSRYLRHRFPPEIISHAVWLYHRYCLSFRDVEDLLAERGIIVSYETIRQWCGKFGPDYARRLKRRQGRLGAGPRAPDSNPDPPGAGGVGPRGAAPGPWRVSPPGPARVTRSSPRAAAEVSPAKLAPADARAAAEPIASVSHQQCWPVRRSSVSWSETPQAGQVCCIEIWRAGSAWILGHMPTSRMRDGLQGSTVVKAAGVEPEPRDFLS